MLTITEDYCSFEVAKLLKEKGFNEPIRCWYDNTKDFHGSGVKMRNSDCIGSTIMCPTHQMAMKWLRKEHNTNIDIVSVWNQKRFEYQVFVVTPENAKHCYIDDKLYLDYEEACETAIKYCLKHLI